MRMPPVMILCGGKGTRLREVTELLPKPMVPIGEQPILWHIMKHYSFYGYNEFIICAGYKQNMIKEWFSNYYFNTADVTFDFTDGNRAIYHNRRAEPWKVTVVDTGLETLTGGRLKKIGSYLGDETFFMTYGDGVSDVDIRRTLEFHRERGKLATITAIQPEGRFGYIDLSGDRVNSFREKSERDTGWINAGFMVLEPKVLDYIEGNVMFEREPMEKIAADGQMVCYRHTGFWQCMDTLRDKEKLEKLWADGSAPWKYGD